ncbi:hypothetical protein JCM10207_000352 [Rhodosporidiobolus poonsookiae]
MAEHATSILAGGDPPYDPTEVNPSKPIVLIVIQLSLIIILARLLGVFFGKLRQPRVVSEILAGILLGPTAFGRIPGFTEHIFPQASITYLTLLSEVGLVLFLFCVGMEADMGLLKRNFKPSMAVSLSGLAVPFGIGCAVSVGLFHQFGQEGVKFTTFMTFIGTSSSITALPVLARILGELQLMQDKVGLVALASGVVNDVIGWALLALSIALANAGKGVVVVYILLTLVAWMLFLTFACRPALVFLARKTGSYGPSGPTQNFVCVVLVLVLVSGFFCEVIGISAIFGGFLVGLIIPAEFCHPLTAKIEDIVSCILVPLYFATSGLSTNLTLLNSGIIWAWTVCVIVCAFCGKFVACTLAARLTGFNWREAGATGSLMSAKGLIELIVLNQGLQAGIISETVFSIFVLEALLLTIASTPLTLLFYPSRVRQTSSVATTDKEPAVNFLVAEPSTSTSTPFAPRTRFTVVLDQLESLGASMVFAHLCSTSTPQAQPHSVPMSKESTVATTDEGKSGDLGLGGHTSAETSASATLEDPKDATPPARSPTLARAITLFPLRLVELTDRTSSSLLASASPLQLLHSDALFALFRTFTSLFAPAGSFALAVDMDRADLRVEQQENWAEVVARKANEDGAEGVVVGWKVAGGGLGGVVGEGPSGSDEKPSLANPFSHLFPTSTPSTPTRPGIQRSASSTAVLSASDNSAPRFAAFLRTLFLEASCDVSVLIDRTSSSSGSSFPGDGAASGRTEVVVPFFGGADDRTALEMALQLVTRSGGASVVLRVLVIERAEAEGDIDETDEALSEHAKALDGLGLTSASGGATQAHYPTTAHPGATFRSGGGLASETADSVLLAHGETLAASLPAGALQLERLRTPTPLRGMLDALASTAVAPSSQRRIVLLGRSRRDAPSHRLESAAVLAQASKDGRLASSVVRDAEVRRAVGEPACAVLLQEGETWVWVVQSRWTAGRRAAKRRSDEA